jgi:sec-independent protein translocase protein TatB
MFDVAPTELLLLGAVAVAVIPPKDLPRAMRFAGQWIGKARGMARHFRTGLDEMIRQAELEEIESKWRAENERIMREHPIEEVIDHPAPGVPALPTPVSEEPMFTAGTAENGSAENGSELSPPPLPGNPPSDAAAESEQGTELPLGLPPKQ